VTHRWDFGYIISCILHGVGQFILYLLPFFDPSPEPSSPPDWWFFFCNPFDYWLHRDSRGVPDGVLIRAWITGSFRMLFYWLDEIANWARERAKAEVRNWLGYVRGSWATFSDWIHYLAIRLGDGMVWWSDSVVHALDKVYNLLPAEVRAGFANWYQLFQNAVDRSKQWVVDTYHFLIVFGTLAWTWVTSTGQTLHGWWVDARGTLDEFRRDPVGFIQARLGVTWSLLVWFAGSCLRFYVELWSRYGSMLVDFLSDPGRWIWDWLTAELERIW
jgi:hypothetical protein